MCRRPHLISVWTSCWQIYATELHKKKTFRRDNRVSKYLGTPVVCGLNSGHRRPRVGRRLWTWCGTTSYVNPERFLRRNLLPPSRSVTRVCNAHVRSKLQLIDIISVLFTYWFWLWPRNNTVKCLTCLRCFCLCIETSNLQWMHSAIWLFSQKSSVIMGYISAGCNKKNSKLKTMQLF